MKPKEKQSHRLRLPALESGDWRGEVAGSCSVNFGQTVQNGPTRQVTEFTYIVVPALLTMPEDRFTWPAVVMIMVSSPRKENSDDVGFLFKAPNRLSLSLGFDVTRSQFSDLIPMLDAKRIKNFHFTLGAERDAEWPVRSWSTGASLGG